MPKSYTQAQSVVYGRGHTMVWGIVVPVLIALVAFSFGTAFGTLIGLILLIPVVLPEEGPMWYQFRSVPH